MKRIFSTVKYVLVAISSITSLSASAIVSLTGAGATFPAPLYARWADDYQQETGHKINYQGIGSSAGVKQIIAKTIDFAASDAPLSEDKLAAEGLFQFPVVIGGVVLAVNIPGIKPGELLLDGKTLGDIYLGKIKKWNDPAIIRLNPHSVLPDQTIVVVRRADGSGTSFIFTRYLTKVNSEWGEKVGVGASVKWPTGLGGKGNDGIAAFVQRLSGAIGYVEYAYAQHNHLAWIRLLSADGLPVTPKKESFSAAANGADWRKSLAQDLTNQPGDDAWPMTAATFILLHKNQSDSDKGAEILKFFDWTYDHGVQAAELGYATLPDEVVQQVRAAWKIQVKGSDGRPLF